MEIGCRCRPIRPIMRPRFVRRRVARVCSVGRRYGEEVGSVNVGVDTSLNNGGGERDDWDIGLTREEGF